MQGGVPSYTLYGDREADSQAFWLHLEDLPARSRRFGWEIAPHRHDAFFQFFNITGGGGEVLIDGAWRACTAPALLFLPAGAVHGFRFTEASNGTVVTALDERFKRLRAGDADLAAFFERSAVVTLDDDADARQAGAALDRIAAELAARTPGRMALVEALLAEAIVMAARSVGARAGAPAATDRDRARMDRLAALIDRHFAEHQSAGFYASRLGISATHLNRLCRRFAGSGVQALLNARLCEAAKRDLLFTHLPVKAVAFALGFSDPAYFNRFFRRQTGLPPQRWRRRERAAMAAGRGPVIGRDT